MPSLRPTTDERLARLEKDLVKIEQRLDRQESIDRVQQQMLRHHLKMQSWKGNASLVIGLVCITMLMALIIGIQFRDGEVSYALSSEAIVAIVGAIGSALAYLKIQGSKNAE